jgi:tyrosyl-tRNA synthetase
MTIDEQVAYLTRGAAEVIPAEELRAKLERAAASGQPLRVYLGVDPTAPDLHLGHTVVLRKLKHFQELGHTAVFLVGDFSAMIGDPTGQSETRPPLSRDEVNANAQTYLEQVYKILDREKTEVRYNSEWLGKMSSYDIVRLCGHYRLARMLEREDFRSRLDKNLPISVHELLYPLLTAYDAVMLRSDLELGATEQKFNLLVHREIQREYGLEPQIVLTMPILEGLDGVRKMSKSLGNYVGINEAPAEMFGKIMSISDDLMWRYYVLLTDLSPGKVSALKAAVAAGSRHPLDVKKDLARAIVADFHGEQKGADAQRSFEKQFQENRLPRDIPYQNWYFGPPVKLSRLLVDLKLYPSNTEAQRKIREGAVSVADFTNGSPQWRRLTDPTMELRPGEYIGDYVFRAGRRLVRVCFSPQ